MTVKLANQSDDQDQTLASPLIDSLTPADQAAPERAALDAIRADLARRADQPSISTAEMEVRLNDWRSSVRGARVVNS